MKSFIIAMLVICLPFVSMAQSVPVLLKGNVTEDKNNEPIGIQIEFRSRDGKKIRTQSNAKYGTYEQLLNAGESYEVVLSSPNIVRKIDSVKLEPSTKFGEQSANFSVTKLAPGVELFGIDAFDKLSATPKTALLDDLEEIKEMLKFNRSISIEFVVTAKDTYNKAIEMKQVETKSADKKKKKKQKQPKQTIHVVTDPDPDLIKQLVNSRIEEINKIVSDNSWKRYNKRVSVKADFDAGSDSSNQVSTKDFHVVVTAIDMNFDRTE